MATITKEDLIPLLLRPWEPLGIMKKTKTRNVVYHLPNNFVAERYHHLGHHGHAVPGAQLVSVDDLNADDKHRIDKIANKLRRTDQVSFFNLRHQKIAVKLINLFLEQKTLGNLLSAAAYARECVNPYLFNYALTSTILHREDTACLELPSFVSTFPEKFIESIVLETARHEATYVKSDERESIVIPWDYTATDKDPEHRLAYFREDIGVNSHHWHWHLVYPYHGPFSKKDRRGELFYYMHRQMVARYNVERFCNKLLRVERLIDFRSRMREAYYSKIDNAKYPGRPAFQKLRNLDRDDDTQLDVVDLEIWRSRILGAISSGHVKKPNGELGPLNIDTLGDMVEASPEKSPNFAYYGNLHNEGHDIISLVHDPDNKNLEKAGVMSATETAVRDPIFFRWHAFIDYIFQRYKSTLSPYKSDALSFAGLTITDFKVESGGETSKNTFVTSWLQSDVDVSGGLDFRGDGPVNVRFTHLTHADFKYHINYENKGPERTGTCRIFLGPKYNEAKKNWSFNHQRLFMIELDRFPVKLAEGKNSIVRNSKDSSVTIPLDRIFNRVDEKTSGDCPTDFCRCGWPDYMLIPKGTPEGFPCELFVMISDDNLAGNPKLQCIEDAMSYCGSKDGSKFPDSRAMGFPFDRELEDAEGTLHDFIKPPKKPAYNNMCVIDVKIRMNEETKVDEHDKHRHPLVF